MSGNWEPDLDAELMAHADCVAPPIPSDPIEKVLRDWGLSPLSAARVAGLLREAGVVERERIPMRSTAQQGQAESDAFLRGYDRADAEWAAKIEALVAPWDTPHHRQAVAGNLLDSIRALIPADAAEALARVRAEAKAEALREAADAALDHFGTWGGAGWAAWLRERADRIERGES